MDLRIRRARTADVPAVRRLVDIYAGRVLLSKATVTLYEDVQEFWVAETVPPQGEGEPEVVGCGALHVIWDDLAEVRTLAVDPALRGRGVGASLLRRLLETARELGVRRVFCLTFETDFFRSHGFRELDSAPIPGEVYAQLLQSADEGLAEFLDLERVRPNTLGNSRMLFEW